MLYTIVYNSILLYIYIYIYIYIYALYSMYSNVVVKKEHTYNNIKQYEI